MAIYDCFQFFNEEHILDLRINILNEFVDFFVIAESTTDHQGNLKKLNLFDKKNKYAAFSQKMFNYKINLLNETENNWHGSKICLKKNLKSPQWLRNLKFKKYPFWRLDKPKNLQIIENGGWHFAYLQSPENISKKIKSFAHCEFNKPNFVNLKNIKEKINMEKDIFDRGISYKKVQIDDMFPKYIVDNKEKLKEWII